MAELVFNKPLLMIATVKHKALRRSYSWGYKNIFISFQSRCRDSRLFQVKNATPQDLGVYPTKYTQALRKLLLRLIKKPTTHPPKNIHHFPLRILAL